MPTDDRGPADRRSRTDGSDGVSRAELAVMVLSAAFTIGLFVFAVWHAVSGPGAVAPRATVVDSHAEAGGVSYIVELRNPGDVGLVSVTVAVGCTDPPIELVFEHVPPGGRRVGTAVCPAGAAVGNVSVTSWVEQ